VDRLFLDANVLFSAAYREDAGLRRLWELLDVLLLTSRYAVEEAVRNLPEPAQQRRLATLLETVHIVDEMERGPVQEDDQLPEKDRPILRAALHARATHLVTGDVTHFGRFFGELLGELLVVSPGDYLRSRGPG
jgi:predicted nucleic acid-binding protein